MFARWGRTKEEDPNYCIYGPEILDIEVTTKCLGPAGKPCPFCYKSNTPNGTNMTFDTFKTILDKMPKTLTQIAFGADAQATSNPDLFKMMEYARSKEIIPNITVADISDDTADRLVKLCGAVAVSRYADYNICYNSVKKLIDRGLKQVNIHFMLSKETFEQAFDVIDDYRNDTRLNGLNAIVFLSLKQKGRGVKFNSVTQEEFKELIEYAFDNDTPIGFDSCSAHKFLNAVKDRENYKQLEMLAEPCESSLFSAYIDVDGFFHPCSFASGTDQWKEGLDVVGCKNFISDIWNNERTIKFRNNLLKCKRQCTIYTI
jgi:MoaA/NifB/PqqE/SkfB family radical SAM enzyme